MITAALSWPDDSARRFSTVEPWIRQDALYRDVNVAAQREDPASVWRFTQDLIRLRRQIPGFAYADIRFFEEARKDYFCWERTVGSEQDASRSTDVSARTIRVEMNLSAERKALPTLRKTNAHLVLRNYPLKEVLRLFEPYEVRVWRY